MAARQRARLPVSVLLIDIDHFKAYNDRYGHQAGDRCLRDVANAIRTAPQRRRPLDLVARYGGEEFIAVLFGADRAHAEPASRVAVLEAVRELRIAHAGSATRPHVTVSVGVATVEPGRGLLARARGAARRTARCTRARSAVATAGRATSRRSRPWIARWSCSKTVS